HGAQVIRESSRPQVTLIGTGSEVSVVLRAAEELDSRGIGSRVVSMPSWDMFAESDEPYRTATLGNLPTLSVEAAATFGWERYADVPIGIDRFGASAPGAVVMDALGINVDHVISEALRLIEST
ncbi:MAG: transketolase, partial [Actinomycetota bacterium]